MPQISAGVEYALHCLVVLVGRDGDAAVPGSRDLAELQGVPADYAARLFTRLQKAGIVATAEGVRGGLRLARDAAAISVEDVVVAIDGTEPLFACREVRRRCAVLGAARPAWAFEGVCGIHAVMLKAEQAMRAVLRGVSLADLAGGFAGKASPDFKRDVEGWLTGRIGARGGRRSVAGAPGTSGEIPETPSTSDSSERPE